MAKKNSNNAIDFTRILAIKDNLPTLSPPPPVERDGATNEATTGTVVDFPKRDRLDDPPIETRDGGSDSRDGEFAVSVAESTSTEDANLREVATRPDIDPTVLLRIGMSRSLHERVRAWATLEGKTPADLARELLSRRTPLFPRSTPMAQLAREARDSFPFNDSRTRIDVRMQVPLDGELHRRLHQLAALRAQTLVACISDLLESSVPSM